MQTIRNASANLAARINAPASVIDKAENRPETIPPQGQALPSWPEYRLVCVCRSCGNAVES